MTINIPGPVYLFIAVLIGALFWLATRRSWDPRTGSVWSYLTRRVLLTVMFGALWPATLIILIIWSIPAGRRWLVWYLTGPPKAEE